VTQEGLVQADDRGRGEEEEDVEEERGVHNLQKKSFYLSRCPVKRTLRVMRKDGKRSRVNSRKERTKGRGNSIKRSLDF